METTSHLAMPFIMPSQAQKHVTHNEALLTLDSLVQLSVIADDLAGPPALPADGARYLVANGAHGAWAGREQTVAEFRDGGWVFLQPAEGMRAWCQGSGRLLVHVSGVWRDLFSTATTFGLNATADAYNRLVLRAPASLFDHEGTGHRLKINKAAEGDTASVVFQTNYAGRAEFGLAGNDAFSVKVGATDGSWREALAIDNETGRARLPHGIDHSVSGEALRQVLLTPGGDGLTSIWRCEATRVGTPRTAMVQSVVGDVLVLAAGEGAAFGNWNLMQGVAQMRVWNETRQPEESAWIKTTGLNEDELVVTQPADISGWQAGDVLRLGEPATDPAAGFVAVDFSPMLSALYAADFAVAGLFLTASVAGDGGQAFLEIGDGSAGPDPRRLESRADGGEMQSAVILPTGRVSPISQAPLVFVREGGAPASIGIDVTGLLV